ncbi:hypothetical protein [Rhodohalobacter sp.]|uniref:hypothetical protein n=1 Tax=Rhodohalobacter sp. TaxID=1974210 RepID=UPI002ACE6E2C|nr:hypothetical protein [Rhodohalobacter sp.]MDZ7756356.1 hypothetical protein [Rhodohalobacter sp.]
MAEFKLNKLIEPGFFICLSLHTKREAQVVHLLLDPKNWDMLFVFKAIILRQLLSVLDDKVFGNYMGGGHNKPLMSELKERISQGEFKDFEELGIPADAKEVAMMSFFANDLVSGEGFSIPRVTEEKVHFGKISLPG